MTWILDKTSCNNNKKSDVKPSFDNRKCQQADYSLIYRFSIYITLVKTIISNSNMAFFIDVLVKLALLKKYLIKIF